MAGSYMPSLNTVESIIRETYDMINAPNLVPIIREVFACDLNVLDAYLKISTKSCAKFSFLFESASKERLGQYTFLGTAPRKILQTGKGFGASVDPLPGLQAELSGRRIAQVPGLVIPPLTGGAVGYVGYDCVRYFEPKTALPTVDVMKVPESLFMFFDTVVAFDRLTEKFSVIAYLHVPENLSRIPDAYDKARKTIDSIVDILLDTEKIIPQQGFNIVKEEYTSNIGQSGYEKHVHTLKNHIIKGDIIQAVPSQRIKYPTSLPPFNIYQSLREINPSPYLFYIDCCDFQIIGASPELLVKEQAGRIITHPIAGTVRRSQNEKEDKILAEKLRNSPKDRAEHIMLVDLARNDINRVCDPCSTKVDRIMAVEKFSHVQHLVSQVSGVLRKGQTRFDAFRSIFPAGTVSGSPKVKAMQLIAELEREKRGVYAGAVGYFGYNFVDIYGNETEGAMDTCIALRTMVAKDGYVYLQAGGGIVFDSDPTEEYEETVNKLRSNVMAIERAEQLYSCHTTGEGDVTS